MANVGFFWKGELDLNVKFSHKEGVIFLWGKTMDTSDFNAQDRQHLNTYSGFMTFSKIGIIATVVTLVLMAIFLL